VNNAEAKQILITWRAGHAEESDPRVAEALQQVRRDAALRQWFEQNVRFNEEARAAFRQIPVPHHLKERILARARTAKVVHWWQQPGWMAAAAAVVLLLTLSMFWFRPESENSFATFRSRMVRTVLRQYSMDIESSDMNRIRQFLATNNAPADYVLRQGLGRLPALGAGVLSWQDQKVSMVCLVSTNQATLFLFIVDRASVKQAPADAPEFAEVSKLLTASWTQGDNVYVLATQGNHDTIKGFF
jgi:hypothetical protein